MNILVIAPHADDEILGVAGTICKHLKNGDCVFICIVAKAEEEMFSSELVNEIRRETIAAHQYLKINKTYFLDFPVLKLIQTPSYIISDAILKVINEVLPDIAYIPFRGDMHIDHKVVFDCSLVALRPIGKHIVKEIYAYETLSETEWAPPFSNAAFIPNVWVDITDTISKKIEAMNLFKTQLRKCPHPRSIETIRHLSGFRGSTVGFHNAESFMLIRKVS